MLRSLELYQVSLSTFDQTQPHEHTDAAVDAAQARFFG
jgi:hypothetical protein